MHIRLDAPDQFANDVCFRLALLRRRRVEGNAPYHCDAARRRDGGIAPLRNGRFIEAALPYGHTASPTENARMIPHSPAGFNRNMTGVYPFLDRAWLIVCGGGLRPIALRVGEAYSYG